MNRKIHSPHSPSSYHYYIWWFIRFRLLTSFFPKKKENVSCSLEFTAV